MSDQSLLAQIKWNADGLVPAIVQDAETREVLMMAWMDESSVLRTLETRQTHFYSRSRKSAWHKGGTSGHVQHVEAVRLDCDGDTLLVLARQVGGACHEGYFSCFSREVNSENQWDRVAQRVFDPEKTYASGH